VTSGIRIGTPAVTTRGMKEPQMRQIADFIDQAVAVRDDAFAKSGIREQVKELAKQFPLYPELKNA
jgi:glycine hydroxymethyltransferase